MVKNSKKSLKNVFFDIFLLNIINKDAIISTQNNFLGDFTNEQDRSYSRSC